MNNIHKQHTGLFSPLVDGMRMRKVAAHLKEGKRILDIGCGPGLIIPHLPDGCHYVGVDRDPAIVAYNSTRFKQFFFIQADPATDPWPIKSADYDFIVMAAFLEHLKNPRILFSEAARVLKTDGEIIMTTPSNFGGKLHDVMAHLSLLSKEAAHEHEFFWSPETLKPVLDQVGLTLTAYRKFQIGCNQFFQIKKGGYRA